MDPYFIHLRLHTEYSLSDGILTISSLMEKACAFAMPAIAITDISNLYATVKFYQEAFKAGIKPIIGVDVWVVNHAQSKESFRMTLLCQTNEGYKNLLKLVSKSYLDGQISGKPLIEKSWLESLSHGLIALSGGFEGEIGQALLSQDKEAAIAAARYWQALFPHRFYIEVSRVGKSEENNYISSVIKLAQSVTLPIVATNDVRFLERDDFEAHEARVCIQEGVILNDPRQRLHTDQQPCAAKRKCKNYC